ncbi:hypothetical protein B0H14DRAFT_1661168 [Mycena olivaceomarginata]|nr:hypothetical protein B0H14DRAFT_1661168 [Mycena olivaceomarginata]
MYFGHCLYILNPKRNLVSLVIVFLGLISLATALTVTIRSAKSRQHSQNSPIFAANVAKAIMTKQSAAALPCDVVITAALTHVLKGRKGGIEVTRSIIKTLTINAVSRGVLTALCAAVNMILFLVQPDTFYFYLGLVLSGKLYMNSMLATLNTRQHLRRRGQNSQGVDAIGETSRNRGLHPNHTSSHNTGIIVLEQTTTADDSKTFNAVSFPAPVSSC